MRTLVISDLHLGGRLEHAVLTRREPLARLLAAIDDVQRLVLLGDTVELLEGRPHQAMEIAEPILRRIGSTLGPDREVILVPGNHDGQLIRAWALAQGRALRPAAEVPRNASPALARVTSWLAPARVRVHYPGVWLSDGIWATHGHYLDNHLVPVSAFGVLGRARRNRTIASEYEHAHRPSFARFTRWIPRPLATLLDDAAELIRAATMPAQRHLLKPHWAPLTSMLLSLQMRRASIPALLRVVHRLGVDAEVVIFGHVHRLGPLAGDDLEQWRGPGGRPRIVNTGSWLHEPLLVHRATPPHPYWPGGAVLVETGAEPRAIGLLDDLPEPLLH